MEDDINEAARLYASLKAALAHWNLTKGTAALEVILAEHGIETGNKAFLSHANRGLGNDDNRPG